MCAGSPGRCTDVLLHRPFLGTSENCITTAPFVAHLPGGGARSARISAGRVPLLVGTSYPYVLFNIHLLREIQHLLVPSYLFFIVRADDIRQVKRDKMRLLRAVTTADNYQALLREFIVSPS